MDTLSTVTKLIEKNCFMSSVDLKDAYYSVPIAKAHRKYLRFQWLDKLYQFTCLPNGLSCAPRKFTKLLKPPLTKLHLAGHIAVNYIDDLYLQGRTYDDCLKNVADTILTFNDLGFVIHPEKSVFKPAQQLVFLGFVLNSVTMTISLTQQKAGELSEICTKMLHTEHPTIRDSGKSYQPFRG